MGFLFFLKLGKLDFALTRKNYYLPRPTRARGYSHLTITFWEILSKMVKNEEKYLLYVNLRILNSFYEG